MITIIVTLVVLLATSPVTVVGMNDMRRGRRHRRRMWGRHYLGGVWATLPGVHRKVPEPAHQHPRGGGYAATRHRR